MESPIKSRGFLIHLIRENSVYFLLFLVFLLVGAILLVWIDQGDAIFFFSDHRTTFWNRFFLFVTKLGEELVFFVALFLLLFIKFRYALFLPLLGFLVSFTSFLSKRFFAHDRPYLFFRKTGVFDQLTVVDGVILNGGNNSFPSGHTMAAFALFTFLALVLPVKRGVAVFLFGIALLVGISRIYLVQHFLKDVYLGAIIGVALAAGCYFLQQLVFREPNHWGNKSLRDYI